MRSTPYECMGRQRCDRCDGDGCDWSVATDEPGHCSACSGSGEVDCDCCDHTEEGGAE